MLKLFHSKNLRIIFSEKGNTNGFLYFFISSHQNHFFLSSPFLQSLKKIRSFLHASMKIFFVIKIIVEFYQQIFLSEEFYLSTVSQSCVLSLCLSISLSLPLYLSISLSLPLSLSLCLSASLSLSLCLSLSLSFSCNFSLSRFNDGFFRPGPATGSTYGEI